MHHRDQPTVRGNRSHMGPTTRSIPPRCIRTSMNSKRHYSARQDSGFQPTNDRGPHRPPRRHQQQQQRRPASGESNNKTPLPTHFLALPIGHHPELRNKISALTSSWLAHEPAIEGGLDPSIIVHPRRLHLTLGVMALTTTTPSSSPSSPAAAATANSSDEKQERRRDLASASALLDSLSPRIRTLLEQNPLRVPLGRLAIMQSDPVHAHVLYAEPDLMHSPDGQRLRAVCGASSPPFFFFFWTNTVFPAPSSGHRYAAYVTLI